MGPDVRADRRLLPATRRDSVPSSPALVPWSMLTSSHARPCHGDGRCPLAAATDLGHGVLRGNREEQGPVLRHHVPRGKATCLLLGQGTPDFPQRPPSCVGERFPTILRDKHHMILAVPLGIAERLTVWHDKLPLGGTLSGSPEGVCCFDSWNCQTLGVPRQSRGFTLIKLQALS